MGECSFGLLKKSIWQSSNPPKKIDSSDSVLAYWIYLVLKVLTRTGKKKTLLGLLQLITGSIILSITVEKIDLQAIED